MCAVDERSHWRTRAESPRHVLLCAAATDTTITVLISTALALKATMRGALDGCCARLTRFQPTPICPAARISTGTDQIGILVGHVVRLNLEGFALARCSAVI